MTHRLRKYFIAGIVALAPLLVTILLVNWLIGFALRISKYIHETYQFDVLIGFSFPGMDILFALGFIVLTGAITTRVVGGRAMKWVHDLMERIPLVRTTHKATRQLLGSVFGDSSKSFRQVVWLEFPQPGQWVLGFVTGDGALPGCSTDESLVAVFVPSTPLPTTGWLLYVDPGKLRYPELTVEQGMKLVLSGGVLASELKKAP
ncbi:MAG: DUF502 domain-containing protein [Zetaproteobacteria bacterium]|nr:DUF502 domain-containing protein [Zetaproteobacteria bacterium]